MHVYAIVYVEYLSRFVFHFERNKKRDRSPSQVVLSTFSEVVALKPNYNSGANKRTSSFIPWIHEKLPLPFFIMPFSILSHTTLVPRQISGLVVMMALQNPCVCSTCCQ